MKDMKLSQFTLAPFVLWMALFFVMVCGLGEVWGQANGDYQTRGDGNWNNNGTWQVRSGGNWVDCTLGDYPGASAGAGTVNLQNNHDVTITADVPNSIGSLVLAGGNRSSSLTFSGNNSLVVSGETNLQSPTSTNSGRYKYIKVLTGTFSTSSIVMAGSSNDGRDSYIQISTGTVNVTGDIAMNSSNLRTYIWFSGEGVLNVGGAISGGGITSAQYGGASAPTSGTVNYFSGGTQNIGTYTYYNLTTSGGGTKSLIGATTVNNNLTLNSGALQLGNNDLTISNEIIQGTPFGTGNMIVTNSTGYVIQNASVALPILFPIGSGGYYSPVSIDATSATSGTISARAIQDFTLGSNYLERYWDVVTSIGGKTITATFNYDPAEIASPPTNIFFKPTAGVYQDPIGTQSFGANSFTITGTTNITNTLSSWTAGPIPGTYFSYQSGNWNNPTTWTSDPGGTTQSGSTVPGNGDVVVILSGRTVSLDANVNAADLEVNINDGGIVDMKTFSFSAALKELNGQGTIKLASANFPTVTTNNFVNTGGGTTEFTNTSSFNLPPAQTTYNNLSINVSSGVTATQLGNISLNGNLQIKQGTFRINDNSSVRRQLTINGNVAVDAGAAWTVGTGNTTNADFSGGTAPFTDYYDKQTHRIVVSGDFVNNGTVKFTNQSYPVYNSFPTDGAATVYFAAANNSTLTCNNTTDFYNLVLDKGVDQTYSLTIYSSAYQNFRLFGRNDLGGEGGTANPNPNLRKALWLRTGTLVLQGLTIIPSLTESSAVGSPNGDFYIPSNGALVLDGTEVVVLSTADDYREVNVAYNVAAANNTEMGILSAGGSQSFSVYGKFQVNNGYFSTRESGGLITWSTASGQFVINGGTIDAKQFRAADGAGLASYDQSGGTLILRGRFQRNASPYSNVSDLVNASINTTRATGALEPTVGTFNLNAAENVFSMSGGTIRIYDDCGEGKVLDVLSSTGNINVTGGTLELIPTNGSSTNAENHLVRSNAPFGNVIINRASSTTNIQLVTYPLTVLSNLSLTSGVLTANDLDVTVGGNFTVGSNGTYNSGTNTTKLNGSGVQILTMDGAINNGATGLRNFIIDKPTGTLTLVGTQPSLVVQGNFDLSQGTLNTGGKTITIAGNVTNSGIHTGTGTIQLNGTNTQTIGGSGNGVFQNIELNNTNGATAPVSLTANLTINGILTFSQNKLFDIKNQNLKMGPSASIIGANANRFVQSNGDAGDGGITKIYTTTAKSFQFPLGSASTSHATAAYAPASIAFGANPTTYGSITVVPVGYEHPNTTTKGRSLTYFWRVKSSGFTLGSATITHSYTYAESDVVVGVNITEAGYVPARYNNLSFNWTRNTVSDVNTTNNVIGGIGTTYGNVSFLDGEFTAGDDNPTNPYGTPTIYYSRINGAAAGSGLWSNVSTWSTTGHTGAAAGSVPGASDVVIIGALDSVYLVTNLTGANAGIQNCASLKIEAGSALDIGYNPGCNFAIVLNHANGNGNFRLTTTTVSGSTYGFPSGDFSEYNVNGGTTEFYTRNPTQGAYFILPATVTSYGNLILSAFQGSNVILPNNSFTTIYGNLTCNGSDADAWLAMSWNGNYGTILPKTVNVKGNLVVKSGSFGFIYNANISQSIIIEGNVYVSPGAGIDVWNNSVNNSMFIGGSLINNSNNINAPYGTPSLVRFINGSNKCDLTFFGASNALITNTINNPRTIFNKLTINKGSSQATTLTIDIGGTLTTPTDNWLTLQNGTLRYMRNNPSSDFTISQGTAFTIPSTAGLYIDYPNNSGNRNILIANAASNNNDLFLNGKLSVINGKVYVGPTNGTTNNNNDIEYSGGGDAAIEVQNGLLMVNGQIRRNPATTNGILSFTQSGGDVVINGQAAIPGNAKLEVTNTGSVFNMSGGQLSIVRGGGTTHGDLYIRAASSTVTGGEIIFTQSPPVGPVVDAVQNYILDANVPLNDLTITGKTSNTARDAKVTLLISPLTLKGALTISNNRSIFDANSSFNIPLTVKGGFTNNGTYNHYNNLTTFNGGVQTVGGSANTDFYDLVVNPVTSLSLIRDVDVLNNLTLSSGQFLNGNYTINVKGNLINNANYNGDAVQGGVILNGLSMQYVSGTGTFGRLELNNTQGARLLTDITLQKNLKLTSGILDINKYMLTLGENSSIEGSGFSKTKMIASDGVFSNVGLRKYFGTYTGVSKLFTFPLGTSAKYTPVVLNYTNIGSLGYIRINNINDNHPGVLDPTNVLDYYWEVESSGITGFKGSMVLNYLQEDVQITGANTEADYIGAALLIPGSSWAKFGTEIVDEGTNKITFDYSSGIDGITGEFTAGINPALPDEVPEFTSINSGDWSDINNWMQTGGDTYALTGAPNGFIVTIDSDDKISINTNSISAYRTSILGELKVDAGTYGHNLGSVSGNGTLALESATFPAGRYNDFLDCGNTSILQYGGSGDYTLVADLYSSIPKLHFVGSGIKSLPNKDLTICKQLLIDGPTLNNNLNNKKLTIQGTMERINGGLFNSGSGTGAIVAFAGSNAQTIGGSLGNFTSSNAFNHFEINNAAGLTVNSGGAIEVGGNLLLTDGNIMTSSVNALTITNASMSSVVPLGGSDDSYVDGPLTKKINQGESFQFPIGRNNMLGNKLKLTNSQSGTILWTAEYNSPNTSYTSFNPPLTYVNSHDYWSVSAVAGSKATINISWDTNSDLTPLNTQNGLSDMRVTKFNATTSDWEEVASGASGSTVYTSSLWTVPSGGSDSFTTACINIIKPKAKLTPSGPVCGNAGIPVTFSPLPPLDYTVTYSRDDVVQTPITFTGAPYIIPTPVPGNYKLVSFTYNGANTGAVDQGIVTAYAVPTTANAGTDQSLCGANSATLAGNTPAIGTGLWTIISGTGGTVTTPTVPTSDFNGTNGSAYTLQWTVSNGGCVSTDQVSIVFPVLAAQPAAFTVSSPEVCNLATGVQYRVPNDPTVTYSWSYSPSTGVTINGSANAVTLDYASNAASGTLSVTATNACGASAARTLAVTVRPVPVVTLTSNDLDNTICTGSAVIFTANNPSGPAITNYNFQVDAVSRQNGVSSTFNTSTLTNGNKVSVIAMSAGSCTTTSNEITISVADGIWTGTTNSDWFNASNWSCGGVPNEVKDVIVPNGVANMPVVNNTGAKFKNIVIQNAASLTSNASYNIEVYGNWINNGVFTSNSGTVIFRESAAISGSTAHIFNNLEVASGKSLTVNAGTLNISGDLTNNGTFVHNNGTLILNGSSIQTITGVNNFYNLVINNIAGATFGNSSNVANSLSLNNGIIYTAGTVTFASLATISPAMGKSNSFIDGKVVKSNVGIGGFTFPIGSANRWRPVSISEVSVPGIDWEAKYYAGPATNEAIVNNLFPTELDSITNMSTVEYWKIADGAASGVTAKVTLSWGSQSNVSTDPDERKDLRIMSWNNTAKSWDNNGGIAPTGDYSFGTLVSRLPLTFSENILTLGSKTENNPLPVELMNFSAKEQDGQVLLAWKTASEQNNNYFIVEHSVDGMVFSEIGKVTGKGTTTVMQQYTFKHQKPVYPDNYYRLKQVDFDGAFEYSDVVFVRIKAVLSSTGISFVMYPNPTTDVQVDIKIADLDNSKPLLMEVISLGGNKILSVEYPAGESDQLINLNLGHDAKKGVYIVRLSQGDQIVVKKLILK